MTKINVLLIFAGALDGPDAGGEGDGGDDAGAQNGTVPVGDLIEKKIRSTKTIIKVKGGANEEQNRRLSLFQCVALADGLAAHRLKRAVDKHVKRCQQHEAGSDVLKSLSEERDDPEERSLQAVESIFRRSFQVYTYKCVDGRRLKTVVVRPCSQSWDHTPACDVPDADTATPCKDKKEAWTRINVVFHKGYYRYIGDLNKFEIVQLAPELQSGNARWRWLCNHRHILTLAKDKNGKVYTDRLCFFRALAVQRGACCIERETHRLFYKFEQFMKEKTSHSFHIAEENYDGINLVYDADHLEECFQVKINIYRLDICEHGKRTRGEEENSEAAVEGEAELSTHICPAAFRLSQNDQHTESLNLVAHHRHLCLITDIEHLSRYVMCGKCRKSILATRLPSHFKRCTGAKTQIIFNRKTYSVSRSLAEEMQLLGLTLPKALEFKKYFIVFDIECYFPDDEDVEKEFEWDDVEVFQMDSDDDDVVKIDNVSTATRRPSSPQPSTSTAPSPPPSPRPSSPQPSTSAAPAPPPSHDLPNESKLQYTHKHKLLSIGIASNVPGHEKSKVLITDGDSEKLVQRFFDVIGQIQYDAACLLAPDVQETISMLKEYEEEESKEMWNDLDEEIERRRIARRTVSDYVDPDNNNNDDDDEANEGGFDVDDGSADEEDIENLGPLGFDEPGENIERAVNDPTPVKLNERCYKSRITPLIGKTLSEARVIPCLGFNSSAYDLSVMAKYLLPYFHHDPAKRKHSNVSDKDLLKMFWPEQAAAEDVGEEFNDVLDEVDHLMEMEAEEARGGHGGLMNAGQKRKNAMAPPLTGKRRRKKKNDNNDEDDFEFDDSESVCSVLKKGSKYLSLKSSRFKFLDITNFCPAGCSLEKYLKAFNTSSAKLFFPYDYMTSLKKLDATQLPPREQWFNELKQQEMTQENYEKCQKLWEEKRMTTFRDWLILYNSHDVEPFVEAIQGQMNFFIKNKIAMFNYVSVASITDKLLHSETKKGVWFSLLGKKDEDLYRGFQDALVG